MSDVLINDANRTLCAMCNWLIKELQPEYEDMFWYCNKYKEKLNETHFGVPIRCDMCVKENP